MANADGNPESDGNRFPELEPILPDEVNLPSEAIPTVEAAQIEKPGFGFWMSLLWCTAFIIVTQVGAAMVGLGCMVIGIATNRLEMPESADAKDMNHPSIRFFLQTSLLMSPVFTIGFSIFMLRWSAGRRWYRRIGLRLPNIEHIIIVLIALPAVEVLLMVVEPIINRWIPSGFDLEGLMQGVTAWPWPVAILALGVGPGIGEELWCRGFLGQGLSRRYGFAIGVIATSFFFGLIHLHPQQAFFAMMVGSLLHLSYLATRSLLVPMLLHFLHNSFVVVADNQQLQIPFLNSLANALMVHPIWFPLAALLLAGTAALTLYRNRIRVWLPNHYGEVSQGELIPRGNGVSLLPRPLHPMMVVALVIAGGIFGLFWLGI